MKNYPLAVQIWLVFAGITLGVAILLALLFPWTLRSFFTREIFVTIETAQDTLLDYIRPPLEENRLFRRELERKNIRTVNHVFFRENGRPIVGRMLPRSFVEVVGEDIRTQLPDVQRYIRSVDDDTIFYVIRREQASGRTVYLVSYVWESYLNDLVRTLVRRLFLILGIVLVASLLPCIWLARYLTRPLVQMEKRVKRIADRDWHEPFVTDRSDEIGRLARSIERMRERLVRQDEAQQAFLQDVSHELKTPVMVIRSYAQSILDGIYPRGDLQGSVQVIDSEAERLEKRIRGLLYMTKLDYLETRRPEHRPFRLDELARDVWERLRWRRTDVRWEESLEPVTVTGDREQWGVLLENLLDNQTRYARERIFLSLRQEAGKAVLRIGNDGPPIPEEEALFKQFVKGEKGEFGLGLAIVQRIARLHRAHLRAANTDDGVCFTVEIPLHPE
jgi:two-component system, OmpR family, sensor histidine kinase CssS